MRRSFQNAKRIEIKLYVKSYLTVQKSHLYYEPKGREKMFGEMLQNVRKKDR